MDRRNFLKLTGLTAASAMLCPRPLPVMAGPFDENAYRKLIPTDKKLDPAWVRSLFERGKKQTYINDELTYIGMPVGGIGTGLVYLGGDGRLWMWDIFNKQYPRGFMGRGAEGDTYLDPFKPNQPFAQGFTLRVNGGQETDTRSLDRHGFKDITFDGRYPIGIITYDDPGCAVTAKLEAFSPFIPLDLKNSSFPATVMRYTLTNKTDKRVSASVAGWIDNPVCLYTGSRFDNTRRRNTIYRDSNATILNCTAEAYPGENNIEKQPDIVFEDFEKSEYSGWEVSGRAFGKAPVRIEDIPEYQGDVNAIGKRLVNSHASAPGNSVTEKDSKTGTLLSRAFEIERNFISFLIGGGEHKGKTCINLIIDGKTVRSVTGHNNNKMRRTGMDVSELRGKTARLMIVDDSSGAWGNIGVDHIVFTNERPGADIGPLNQRHDYGTFALATVDPADHANAAAARRTLFEGNSPEATKMHGEPMLGTLGQTVSLEPGESKAISFIVAWHFPNLELRSFGKPGRWYATRFENAAAVARHISSNLDSLYKQTKLWVDTWYDSTLPYWLLDRTMANTSTLATTVCYLFADGRFYGWEGVNCCPGTCTHVWHYAQAPGRLFPQLERNLRRRVDFGIGQHPNGAISHRTYAETGSHHADDGHCGRILGMYREHRMSTDDKFLRELWPNVKKAIEFMFTRDPDANGILDGAQPNTLDAAWYGQISFTSSLHIAAMRAGEQMAREMGDEALADRCKSIADAGRQAILKLFNGEYFYQIEDPEHSDDIGAGAGCYIDQIFGQTWAHWVGLGRLFDRDKQLTALRSLWKYNFVPDVGPFREHFKRGRWYAKAGDAGLIMCSWPNEPVDPDKKKHWQYGYFNECMSGFEWQAASHMIWEGHDQPELLKYGLAIGRAIHDRYDARLRNPYNEIECSDHYARAMASYGAFQAVCGFNCHGPAGHIEFAPRLRPEDFKAAFTAAGAWGSISQKRNGNTQSQSVEIKQGRTKLSTLKFVLPPNKRADSVELLLNDKTLNAEFSKTQGEVIITLEQPQAVEEGQTLSVRTLLA
ncbi:MAG: hypothetical protein K9N48_01780 [Verrucomicrobia bacterium]|nr:hypothetical protein [Verrucomicrobiota bacterium]